MKTAPPQNSSRRIPVDPWLALEFNQQILARPLPETEQHIWEAHSATVGQGSRPVEQAACLNAGTATVRFPDNLAEASADYEEPDPTDSVRARLERGVSRDPVYGASGAFQYESMILTNRLRKQRKRRSLFTLSCGGPFPLLLIVGSLTAARAFCAATATVPPVPPVSESAAAAPDSTFTLETPESIWESGVGEGFRSKTQSFTVSAGGTYGIAAFGGQEQHHLALGSLTYGHMLGHVLGKDHWYRGNVELRLEVFSGAQVHPDTRWLVGLTPHLRYHFATGTRFIPFMDLGAGVTATSIGPPDLSGTFEFNLQAGTGLQWFVKDNVAISLEGRYLHLSCAHLHDPNLGLNGVTGLFGMSYYF